MYNFKVVVMGQDGAGKTTLINRICKKEYDDNYVQSAKLKLHILTIEKLDVYTQRCRQDELFLYDLPGHPNFYKARQSCYNDEGDTGQINIGIYCVDLTFKTKINRKFIEEEIKLLKNQNPDVTVILVGTKSDQATPGAINKLKTISEDIDDGHFILTSAKTSSDLGVESLKKLMRHALPLREPINNLHAMLGCLSFSKRRGIERELNSLTLALKKPLNEQDTAAAIDAFVVASQAILENKHTIIQRTLLKVASVGLVTLLAAVIGMSFGYVGLRMIVIVGLVMAIFEVVSTSGLFGTVLNKKLYKLITNFEAEAKTAIGIGN